MLVLDKQRALDRMLARCDAMITPDGWFTWMIRDPGPLNSDKVNGGVNGLKMMIPHSAEGYWPYLQTLLHNGPDSWGASNLKDGRCFQHYSIYQQTQTSGAGYPNNNAWTNETEGKAGEPLTEKQTANIVRQIKELSALKLWTPRRPTSAIDKTATLYEHRECIRWAAKYTACPSGRIPWDVILAALEPEEDMKPFLCWSGRVIFVGPAGPVWITKQSVADELTRVFGPMTISLSGEAIMAMGGAP